MIYLTLFTVSFLSATLLPLGSEALLLYDITLHYNIIILFVTASVGNTLGSAFNYYLGYKGEHYILEKKIININLMDKLKSYFYKFGSYLLLFSWLPIVGDPITLIAGLLQYNKYKFILIVLLAKSFRYFIVINLIL